MILLSCLFLEEEIRLAHEDYIGLQQLDDDFS
jgi:hypothetical protein